MTLKERLLWQPSIFIRIGILMLCVLIAMLVGYVHTLTGMAYEFHVFFILPVLITSWFIGVRVAYFLALLSSGAWFAADLALAGEQASSLPLFFNTVMRLAIFIVIARLIGEIHRILLREYCMAREDVLTRLPNRREFQERGRQALAQAQRQHAPVTAVFIDLDRFKEVNDTLGHDCGDRLLVSVADVIRQHIRTSDIPARLGGDEFALLLPNMSATSASTYVDRLRESLLLAMQQQHWPVTFSVGVASYGAAPQDFDALLKCADKLMYQVKRDGRDHIVQQVL
ncbi:GGDEF domain-containing protein [uncultured Dechloromonas sp.]|uniref:GGDEF domain-containing protein n=1 Tax=uncultured Dechloromonas sp. TaxID=171719 RepID=UPI0025F28B38|nr:GGDEF domain-containing protein [uncultured Dechloromonas sp.]